MLAPSQKLLYHAKSCSLLSLKGGKNIYISKGKLWKSGYHGTPNFIPHEQLNLKTSVLISKLHRAMLYQDFTKLYH